MKEMILFFVWCVVLKAGAQPSVEWVKGFGGSSGEVINDVKKTLDGNFICIGQTGSVDGDITDRSPLEENISDIWLVKVTPAGDILWSRTYGGSDNDGGSELVVLPDSNFLLVCNTQSNDSIANDNHGGGDALIIKVDKVGNILWHKCYGSPGGDGTGTYTGKSIITADSSCFIIVGASFCSRRVTRSMGLKQCRTLRLLRINDCSMICVLFFRINSAISVINYSINSMLACQIIFS